MTRTPLRPADVSQLVSDQFGTAARIAVLARLAGGTKKGVYRVGLSDGTSVVLYVWADSENYWPPPASVPDDPFSDASAADLFATSHAALVQSAVRVPRLLLLDVNRTYLAAEVALVEDVGNTTLETLLDHDPGAAAAPMAGLRSSLNRMHETLSTDFGRLAAIARGEAPRARAEDVIVERAMRHLDSAAAQDQRLAVARDSIREHIIGLRSRVSPRRTYSLVHGELGPEHVLVTRGGEAVIIDIEGVVAFDVEWDHAWLRRRFGKAYRTLRRSGLDRNRLALYDFAQTLALIEGPLRIATTDFSDRSWMLELAESNIRKAISASGAKTSA